MSGRSALIWDGRESALVESLYVASIVKLFVLLALQIYLQVKKVIMQINLHVHYATL